jgi:hypothetical protein
MRRGKIKRQLWHNQGGLTRRAVRFCFAPIRRECALAFSAQQICAFALTHEIHRRSGDGEQQR